MSDEHAFLSAACEAARAAGQVLRDWRERFTVTQKSGPTDLVTEADHAAQQTIFEILDARFPDHNFLGEEGLNRTSGAAPYRWVVDPLDGTTNYVHGYPQYCVSIGLEQQGRGLLLGVIYDPNRDELFTGVRGAGAAVNGRPLHVSDVASLGTALVVASLPRGVRPGAPPIQRFLQVLTHAQTLQRTGSAALNLAYLAAGRLDAFWSTSLMPWDAAAGAVLVTEAGGCLTQLSGAAFDVHTPDLLSANGAAVHAELRQLLA